jgi:arginase
MQIQLIGAAIGQCANIRGTEDTPEIINSYLQKNGLTVNPILHYQGGDRNATELQTYFTSLANAVYNVLDNNILPVVIGGDHSCAIGTWSGVAQHLAEHEQSLGLIWIDAHMDAHTPQTTITGNIHGMPLATLLGQGYPELISILSKNPKLDPANVVLIGIRSYEEAEALLLAKLGVKIYYNCDVNKVSFSKVFKEVWEPLAQKVDKIGLTIDIDGFDPKFAPGVGTCEPDGIDFNEFMQELKQVDTEKLAAIEITEANNSLDPSGKTINCVLEIIKTVRLFV